MSGTIASLPEDKEFNQIKADVSAIENNIKYISSKNLPEVWLKQIEKSYLEDNSAEKIKKFGIVGVINYVLNRWWWFKNLECETFKTAALVMQVMMYLPALTIRQLISHLLTRENKDLYISKKEDTMYRMRFGRALDVMVECGLIRTIYLSPEEVGPGKYSVNIYIAPFAEDKQIDKCKQLYLTRGGQRAKSIKKKVAPPEVRAKKLVEFGEMVRQEKKKNIIKEETPSHIVKLQCTKCKGITNLNREDMKLMKIEDDVYEPIGGRLKIMGDYIKCTCGSLLFNVLN